MFARWLAVPFVLAAMFILYLALQGYYQYTSYLIVPLIMLAVIFVLAPQINWWWYKRRPPDLSPGLRALLEQAPGFYQSLNAEDKLRFRQRVALFVMSTDFMPQGMENAPDDVKTAVAASAVTLTFRKPEFLFPKYEHVVLYAHPFPSPQYPETFHTSEVYDDDGVLLFSMEHLMHGFMQPHLYFHSGLYEYAKVFMRVWPVERYPQLGEEHWPALERISGFSRERIEQWVGLRDLSLTAVAAVCYFVSPERFQEELPEFFQQFREMFAA